MALPVYSTRFCAANAANNTVLYTVPSGFVAVIRTITTVVLSSGASAGLEVLGTGAFLNHNTAASAGQAFLENLRHVMNPGEQLVASVSTGNATFVVSGYLLSAT